MDYKQKYKESLKRARDVYTYYCDDREQLRKIEFIFPELKKSQMTREDIDTMALEHVKKLNPTLSELITKGG